MRSFLATTHPYTTLWAAHAYLFDLANNAFSGVQYQSVVALLLQRGSQAGNPAIVTLKGTAKDQLLSHDESGRRW